MATTGTEFVDTVVIGGGQAGLVMGAELARQGRDFVILEAHRRIGDAWRRRWDSLQLFTPARYDGLPGMPFPGDPLSFPTKDEVASYLEAYAAALLLPVRTGVRVDRLERADRTFLASAGDERWESRNVIVATGGNHTPKVPEFAAQLAEHVVQLHANDYRNPAQLPPGPVLVVGMGNSGAEIARDVAATHPTWISGRAKAEIPGHPGRATARLVFPISRFVLMHVLTLANPVGRVVLAKRPAAPLMRTKTSDLVSAGVRVVPRVVGVRDGEPELADGTTAAVSSVIWCTGYRNDFSWIDLPAFDETGEPRHDRGVVQSVPGLYFLGLEFLYALASATIPGIGRDARYLAKHLPPVSSSRAETIPGAASGEGGHRVKTTAQRVL